MTDEARVARSFTIVRRFAAPRRAVFDAWTDPRQLGWFNETGAQGVNAPIEVDLRVGGSWSVLMVESADRSYRTGGVYREVRPPERLVFIWGATGGWPNIEVDRPEACPVVTVTFEESEGITEMLVEVVPPAHHDGLSTDDWLTTAIEEGWSDTLDRLGRRFPLLSGPPR